MPRTIISLSDDDKRWLDREALARHVSMTSLVSEAVALYRAREESANRPDFERALKESSGVWRQGDGMKWQERLRDEWSERV